MFSIFLLIVDCHAFLRKLAMTNLQFVNISNNKVALAPCVLSKNSLYNGLKPFVIRKALFQKWIASVVSLPRNDKRGIHRTVCVYRLIAT